MDTFTAQIPDTDNLADMPELLVNGVAFIELVKQHELPFAMAEGNPDLAGDYFATGATAYYPTGHPTKERFDGEEKSMLLGCAGCGIADCWPLLARVVTQGRRWSGAPSSSHIGVLPNQPTRCQSDVDRPQSSRRIDSAWFVLPRMETEQ